MRLLRVAFLCVMTGAAATAASAASLSELANGDHRSEAHKVRNQYRHPVKTLQWIGLEPDMTVVEVWPSGGWYAEIIAPYVADRGQYIAAVREKSSWIPFRTTSAEALRKRMKENAELYGDPKFTELRPPAATRIAEPGSVDMVLTFRNVHNWMADGNAPAYFEAFYEALKPGGILGVVQHRDDSVETQDPRAPSGYVKTKYVIDLAMTAGFEVIGESEINANPEDDHDHPEGVWTLPPTLALGEENREKYLEIGESDRMTLKFIKKIPVSQLPDDKKGSDKSDSN